MQNWNGTETLGEYRLEHLLGQGGAGLVFLARHVRLGHAVVIKLLRKDRDSSEQRGRFLREGQALSRLHHPGIVRLLHADTLADGTEYLVLEYTEGMSLRQLLHARSAPLTTLETVRIVAEVASALADAHKNGVVHRDVKPENLIVCPAAKGKPSPGRIVVIDFGLAYFATAERATLPWPQHLTQLDTKPGSRPGTPHYRAPELGPDWDITSEESVAQLKSPALDAYALGVVGWELLIGSRPSAIELLDPVQHLCARRQDAPADLIDLICRLLSFDPQSRPALSQVAAQCTALAEQIERGHTPKQTNVSDLHKSFAQQSRRLRLSIPMIALFCTVAASLLFVAARLPLARFSQLAGPHTASHLTQPQVALTQPMLGVVSDAEILKTIGTQPSFLQRVDLAPMQQLGPKLNQPDWSRLAAAQTEQVHAQLIPLLHRTPTPQLSYFGLAPVPLAIQLGVELSGLVPISVYQRNHKNGRWEWPHKGRTQDVLIHGLPQSLRRDAGPVILRVSASALIDPALTHQVVEHSLAEIDIALRTPSPDALQSEADVEEVAAMVQHALNQIARLIPRATVVHLFAAVPGALALRIGMVTNPNIHPPIQTYHFDRDHNPSYSRALLLPIGSEPSHTGDTSMPNQTQSVIERRFEHFVDWLRPDDETVSAMARQAHEIRDKIREQAAADRLTVRSTPGAGSFVKKTGIRRHVTGGSAVDGQDVDIPFVLAPMTEEEQRISRLLDRFQSYADRAYPQRPPLKSRTKSSIKIEFVGSKLSFDLVPMIQATDYGDDYQWLLRGDGTKRLTSVEMHNRFIKKRTDLSNQVPGRVKFNECVRLLKWWREFRMNDDRNSIAHIPSILIEMLSASAFDQKSVQATYSETLLSWFDHLYGVVSQRKRISFPDYLPPRGRRHADKTPWMVIEPVDPQNNLTHDWNDQHIEELAGWLKRGRDDLRAAVDLDRRNNPQESLHYLVRIFGSPFKHHCGD